MLNRYYFDLLNKITSNSNINFILKEFKYKIMLFNIKYFMVLIKVY